MGVDIWIPNQAKAQHALAGCRGYVYGSPTYIFKTYTGERAGILRIDYVFPLAAIPITLRLADGRSLCREGGTAQRFGVEIVALYSRHSQREKYYVKRWLSQAEYQALKPFSTKPSPWTGSPQLSVEKREIVCAHCPLALPDGDDCGPRLFGYSRLPSLRRAASELLTATPFPLYRVVNQLLTDLSALFPEGFERGRPAENRAGERENDYRRLLDTARAQGHQILIGDVEPPSELPVHPLGDALLGVLFFRTVAGDENPQDWISPEKLALFVNWLDQLLSCLHDWQLLRPFSADMTTFYSVMKLYTAAHRHALRYQITLAVSW